MTVDPQPTEPKGLEAAERPVAKAPLALRPSATAIHFTAIDHEAECIREALRKIDTVELRASDPDPTASRAFEALGYLLTTIKSAT